MSKWRVGYDCGEWFVSEIGDQWGSFDSFATEAEAVEELRRVQFRAVETAEEALSFAKRKLAEKQATLAAPPRVHRMAPEKRSTDR